jgi:hypothetical protein
MQLTDNLIIYKNFKFNESHIYDSDKIDIKISFKHLLSNKIVTITKTITLTDLTQQYITIPIDLSLFASGMYNFNLFIKKGVDYSSFYYGVIIYDIETNNVLINSSNDSNDVLVY